MNNNIPTIPDGGTMCLPLQTNILPNGNAIVNLSDLINIEAKLKKVMNMINMLTRQISYANSTSSPTLINSSPSDETPIDANYTEESFVECSMDANSSNYNNTNSYEFPNIYPQQLPFQNQHQQIQQQQQLQRPMETECQQQQIQQHQQLQLPIGTEYQQQQIQHQQIQQQQLQRPMETKYQQQPIQGQYQLEAQPQLIDNINGMNLLPNHPNIQLQAQTSQQIYEPIQNQQQPIQYQQDLIQSQQQHFPQQNIYYSLQYMGNQPFYNNSEPISNNCHKTESIENENVTSFNNQNYNLINSPQSIQHNSDVASESQLNHDKQDQTEELNFRIPKVNEMKMPMTLVHPHSEHYISIESESKQFITINENTTFVLLITGKKNTTLRLKARVISTDPMCTIKNYNFFSPKDKKWIGSRFEYQGEPMMIIVSMIFVKSRGSALATVEFELRNQINNSFITIKSKIIEICTNSSQFTTHSQIIKFGSVNDPSSFEIYKYGPTTENKRITLSSSSEEKDYYFVFGNGFIRSNSLRLIIADRSTNCIVHIVEKDDIMAIQDLRTITFSVPKNIKLDKFSKLFIVVSYCNHLGSSIPKTLNELVQNKNLTHVQYNYVLK